MKNNINGIIVVRDYIELRQAPIGKLGYLLPTAFIANSKKQVLLVDTSSEFYPNMKSLKKRFFYEIEPFIPVVRLNDNKDTSSYIFYFNLNPFYDTMAIAKATQADIDMYSGPDEEDFIIFDVDEIASIKEDDLDSVYESSYGKLSRKDRKKRLKRRLLFVKEKSLELEIDLLTKKEN